MGVHLHLCCCVLEERPPDVEQSAGISAVTLQEILSVVSSVRVEEGDEMEIDLRRDVIELLVGDSLLDARESAWTPPPPTRERGWLAQYSRLVQPIDKGATLVQPPSASQLLTDQVSSEVGLR